MARASTFTAAVTGALATVHICRFMLGDSSIRFGVLGKFEFENFKRVQIHFHADSPPFMLTLNDAVPLNAIT
ncbi:MAG: hypothetical protein IKP64_07445 [Selenomonadaceae bacterium]|nr:hypothetical protein [Selenomonadaceae bacterium]